MPGSSGVQTFSPAIIFTCPAPVSISCLHKTCIFIKQRKRGIERAFQQKRGDFVGLSERDGKLVSCIIIIWGRYKSRFRSDLEQK